MHTRRRPTVPAAGPLLREPREKCGGDELGEQDGLAREFDLAEEGSLCRPTVVMSGPASAARRRPARTNAGLARDELGHAQLI